MPGQTAFPVRLASELVQRAFSHTPSAAPLLYDRCCGGGYMLTVVGFLHGARLRGLVGSDIGEDAVSLGGANLSLLDPAGLRSRAAKIGRDAAAFGKETHREALASAKRLVRCLPPRPLLRRTFVAAVGDPAAIRQGLHDLVPDIVITDVPYSRASAWAGQASVGGSDAMLAAVADALPRGVIVALATSKLDRPRGEGYDRLERWQLGTRALTILRRR